MAASSIGGAAVSSLNMAAPSIRAYGSSGSLSSNVLQPFVYEAASYHRGDLHKPWKLDSSLCINHLQLDFWLSSYILPKKSLLRKSLELSWNERIVQALSHSSHTKTLVSSPCILSSHLRSWRPAKVKSEDTDGIANSKEDMIWDEQALKQALHVAIKEENYTRAAEIRDSLRNLYEDSKISVLSANNRFYNAFRNGDLATMQSLWANQKNVYCIHPGAGRILGYDLVIQSWEVVLGFDYEFPLEIELQNVEAHVRGDVGYVTCIESVRTKGSSWGKQIATNVFERIDGEWFISIHHASHVEL
ncbi:uncharacterized protein [Aristolochia californica]|uniref:uncharacterized protein n=1 Tax=Aristolochia californica TaxID=171875 RepID=UPI0035D8DC2E